MAYPTPGVIPGLQLQTLITQPAPGVGAWVIFAHGSGSSRLSPRNQQVARSLEQLGLGTLLFDLLTEQEARESSAVFNIDLLALRLQAATQWLRDHHCSAHDTIGFFGASTGAAAALTTATALSTESIRAVVCRSGRPDLAPTDLSQVSCPTLLIVGDADDWVLEVNRRALEKLPRGELMIVPRATHLFEEPGALVHVQEAAGWFFLRHLVSKRTEAKPLQIRTA